MAQLVTTFDTVNKKLTATLDGRSLGAVAGVLFGRDGSGYTCEVTGAPVEDDDGVKTVWRLVASDSQSGRHAVQAGRAFPSQEHAGFVWVPAAASDALQDHIQTYFSR